MSYENFVMRTMRQQLTPRSYAEAYKTAEYACAIYQFKTEHRQAWERFADIVTAILIVCTCSLILFGCTQWLK